MMLHVQIQAQVNSRHQFARSPCMTENPEATCSKSSITTKSGDGIIKTVDIHSSRGGQFSVAARDASLLERIAHKATKETRVLEPHEVFIELEELQYDSMESLEWKETARWIKFEEDVEQEVGRWGRPHVSALAFHSLVDLRKGLEKGTCTLFAVFISL